MENIQKNWTFSVTSKLFSSQGILREENKYKMKSGQKKGDYR